MSVSGPSPLGTLMVQRVEAALGVTLAQQANLASGARPDAVTQPGQPDKVDPTKNPPPKEHEGSRRAPEKGTRQSALAALSRNNPEIAKLLAARNAPMTSFTASAPTSLGPAAKAILVLLQQFPEARPAVTGRAPLLTQTPGQSSAGARGAAVAGGQGSVPGAASSVGAGGAAPSPGTLDPNAVDALAQRGEGGGNAPGGQGNAAGSTGGTPGSQAGAAAAGQTATGATPATAANPATAAGAATLGSAGTPGAVPGGGAPAAGASTPGAMGTQFPPGTGMAGQLAHALANAVQSSGLFYESHLRDLAFGLRNAAELRAEPQAQAGHLRNESPHASDQAQARGEPGTSTAAGQPGDAQSAGRQPGAHPAASHAAAAYATTASAANAQAGHASAQLAGALLGLDPSTHMLVRQQLEALANQALVWQGEAWPGAEMEWEVQRREPREGDAEQTESWATRLKLQLPGMGEVTARLSLAGSQLVVHLASPQGADLMADHTDLLRQRLSLQGLTLSQLTISRESDAGEGSQPGPAPLHTPGSGV